MESVSVGLDIGSSAVRAAEIASSQGRLVLRAYGQVGIPHGYVVDGDVVNVPGVSAALRRLWTEGGFTTNKVVLGVSGPRVFIRQAEVPALSRDDLKSSLKFDAQELVPIPMEDASFDFSVLDEHPATPVSERADGTPRPIRILLAAAHRELLSNHMAALEGAGLRPVAIDPSPMALMRVAPPGETPPDGAGVEVLVSVGAELTTIAVREDGVPRFIRTLSIGGNRLTESLANTMHLELAVAETLKRGAVPPNAPQVGQARKAISHELRDLAEDVRGTIDFFLNQSGRTTVDRLLITGGASQTEGLAAAIASSQIVDVFRIDPFTAIRTDGCGLSDEQLRQASSGAATPIGLALWSFDTSPLRLSMLPEEVAAARRARRIMMMGASGVAGVAVLLGAAGLAEIAAVHNAQHQVAIANAQVSSLTSEVSRLQAETAIHGQVGARAKLVVTALQGDVDWVRVLGQLAQVMPPNITLSTFAGARTSGTPSTASTSPGVSAVGTVTFAVQGTGGLPAVASWLRSLQSDPDLQGSWIGGISTSSQGQSQLTLSTTSNLTNTAQSNRAAEVKS